MKVYGKISIFGNIDTKSINFIHFFRINQHAAAAKNAYNEKINISALEIFMQKIPSTGQTISH